MTQFFKHKAMIPSGYIVGLGRNPGEEDQVAHLYKGDYNGPMTPMCVRGWNRSDGARFSIYRGQTGNVGV